ARRVHLGEEGRPTRGVLRVCSHQHWSSWDGSPGMTMRGSLRGSGSTVPRLLLRNGVVGSATLPAENVSVQETSAVGIIGRFGWALADQVLSSATNFLLALFVARTVGSRELGAFSMAYATFTFSLGAVRAIAGELLVVRHSAVSSDGWRGGVNKSAGTDTESVV